MSSIPINYTFTETLTTTSMEIEITQLVLFTSCQFRVTFFDQDETPIKCQILIPVPYEKKKYRKSSSKK